MKLKGKVSVITGAGSGIGRAIAVLFAEEGAKVVLNDVNQESLDEVTQSIREKGGDAVSLVGNVMNEEDVQKMIDTAVDVYGSVDVLVNNAGILDGMVPAAEVTDELWERVLGVNLTGPMRTIRKSLPIMLKQGSGVIINIASIGGLFGSRAGTAYTASKHGIIGLTKNVGFQYAKQGIRCNAIAPGGVETNIAPKGTYMNPFGTERAMAGIQINPRTGKPEEIAHIALFLASEDSSFINGAVITADAGWTAY